MTDVIILYWATITKMDRRKPVLSGFKRGDDVTLNYGPEMIHIVFDNNQTLVVEPAVAERLGWTIGDRIEFSAHKEPAQ